MSPAELTLFERQAAALERIADSLGAIASLASVAAPLFDELGPVLAKHAAAMAKALDAELLEEFAEPDPEGTPMSFSQTFTATPDNISHDLDAAIADIPEGPGRDEADNLSEAILEVIADLGALTGPKRLSISGSRSSIDGTIVSGSLSVSINPI